MQENHKREQYFFDPPTVDRFATLLARYERPCCLGAPRVAEALVDRGRRVRLLDVDERFSALPGFVAWDMYRPRPLGERFDVVFCDPPFTKVTLAQLFAALRVLCDGQFATPLALCHLASRAADVCATLARFDLRATAVEPGYISVRPIEENRVLLYANFELPDDARSSSP